MMMSGVRLLGQHDTPPCYPENIKLATLTEDDLRKSAKWRRAAILGKNTIQEVERGKHLIEATIEELQLDSWRAPSGLNRRSPPFSVMTGGLLSGDLFWYKELKRSCSLLMIAWKLN